MHFQPVTLTSVVAGKSVSHHHRHSTWQRTELQRVYADTGMMETDWATLAYGDTGVPEMDGVMGSIYLGDPGVDSFLCIISSHTISSHYTMNYTLHVSHLLISLALSATSWVHAAAWILTAW